MNNYKTFSTEQPLTEEELNGYSEKNWDVLCMTYNAMNNMYDYIFVQSTQNAAVLSDTPLFANTPSENNASKSRPFMFKRELCNLGVSGQAADDWIKVRKAQRAAQTETAFSIIKTQIKLIMQTYGVDADAIIRVCVDRNWRGLKAEWFDNIEWSFYGVQPKTSTPHQTMGNLFSQNNNNEWE